MSNDLPAPPSRRVRKRSTAYHHGELRPAAVRAALSALDRGRPLPSLRELAAECAVAHPSLYRHFANAEALALTVAAACFREHTRHVTAAFSAAADPFGRLRAGCEAAMRWGLAHPGRYGLMMSRTLAGKQHHVEFFEAARESFGGLVEAVRRCGVPEPVPVAHTLMSAMHGLVDLLRKGRTIPGKAATVDEQIGAMLAMLLAYVRTRIVAAAADGAEGSDQEREREVSARGRPGHALSPGWNGMRDQGVIRREAAVSRGGGMNREKGRDR